MRRLMLPFAILTAAAASLSAAAQTAPAPPRLSVGPQASPYAGILAAQQEQAARQAVIQQTELSRLDAQLRTQQNLALLQALGTAPQIPAPPATAPPRQLDVSGLASMPDAALADSNAKVKAAAGDRP